MRCLEKRFNEKPGEDDEKALTERYHSMLHYSFNEGAFSNIRGVAAGRTPLWNSAITGQGISRRRLSFYWRASLDQFSGYGRASNMYINALNELGHEVQVEDAAQPSKIPLKRELKNFHFLVNHHWRAAGAHPDGPCRMQVYACETTVIPQWLIDPFNRMMNRVPSSFCRQALIDSGVTAHISIVPYAIDKRRFKPRFRGEKAFHRGSLLLHVRGQPL